MFSSIYLYKILNAFVVSNFEVMYAGGIADKLGNRYEAKYLVYKILEMIAGEVDWIHFEGLTEEFRGFEFSAKQGGQTNWYQTKISISQGNWTLRRLDNEGVLKAFAKRLGSDPKCLCHFVSQNPSKDLSSFSDKARIASDVDDFLASLSHAQREKLTDISTALQTDDRTTFNWLRRSYFEVLSQDSIESSTRTISKLLFTDPQLDIFPILRDLLEKNFNRKLTVEEVRQFFAEAEIGFKDWRLTPTLRQNIAKQTKRYLNTYNPFGAGGEVIERKETAEVLSELQKPDGAKIIFLAGEAGSGKSGVVRAVIDFLDQEKIIHLAFRVDRYLDCATPEDIGSKILGRNENPVITLHGGAVDQPSVLIVDQVDAVSEVSGRSGAVKDAILEFFDSRSLLDTKIIYVCRSFDLENDARLKSFLGPDGDVAKIQVNLLNWEEDVKPILQQREIAVSTFTDQQKSLLTLPLNLSIYLSIGEKDLRFDSREELFDALLAKRESSIRERDLNWSFMEPLNAIAIWMSKHQTLVAPSRILYKHPQAARILRSEGLIVTQDKKVSFFHESFFDYLFARQFLSSDQSILELLLSVKEQYLFRRTQVRQILEVLRQDEYSRYLLELESLFCNDVRYHIRLSVAAWLGALKNPKVEEFEIVNSMFDDGAIGFSRFQNVVLLGNVGWFEVHIKTNWFSLILNGDDEERQHQLVWWLLKNAHHHPNEVAGYLRQWWNNEPNRALVIINRTFLISAPDIEGMLKPVEQLYCDLIETHADIFFGDEATRKRRTRDDIIYTWLRVNIGSGSEVLKSYFRAWFAMHPNDQPFSFQNISEFDLHTLSEATQVNTEEVLRGFTEALPKSITIINDKKLQGHWDSTFDSFSASKGHGDDELVGILRSAFRKVAGQAPEVANHLLSFFDPKMHRLFLHLHLEAYAESPDYFKNQFIALLHYEDLFSAGSSGITWKSFAVTAKGVIPFCDTANRIRIENKIKTYSPELDAAIKHVRENGEQSRRDWILSYLRDSGYEQWCILDTIGIDLLSEELIQLHRQLGRKFPHRKVGDTESTFSIRKIKSPISQRHARFMSDDEWLKAIKKYSHDRDVKGPNNYLWGGAEQLGNVLRECTKEKPNRFSALLLKVPQSSHSAYAREILYGLSQSKDCKLKNLRLAIDYAHQSSQKKFALEVSRLIEQYPAICKEQKYLDILFHYARAGAADENRVKREKKKETREIHTIEEAIGNINDLYSSGINDVRGAAVRTLARVYWMFRDYTEQVESFLQDRIYEEPFMSVRCVMVDLLLPFFNADKVRCGQFYLHLITHSTDQSKTLDIVTSSSGIKLIKYMLWHIPEIGIKIVDLLLESSFKKHQLVGAWLVFSLNYQVEGYQERAQVIQGLGVEFRRIAAQVTAQYLTITKFRERAFASLVRYFDDADTHVKQNAATVFREIEADKVSKNHDVLNAYLEAKVDYEDYFDLFRFLKKASSDISPFVIQAAEKIVLDLKNKDRNSHRRLRAFSYLDELLQIGYSDSEHKPELRTRYLDVLDSLLELEVHESSRLVKAYDRAN